MNYFGICIGSVRLSALELSNFLPQYSTPTHQHHGRLIPYVLIYLLAKTGQSSEQVCSTEIIPFWNTRDTLFGSLYDMFNKSKRFKLPSPIGTIVLSFRWDIILVTEHGLSKYYLTVLVLLSLGLTSHLYGMYHAI